jgi:hypothetical protein
MIYNKACLDGSAARRLGAPLRLVVVMSHPTATSGSWTLHTKYNKARLNDSTAIFWLKASELRERAAAAGVDAASVRPSPYEGRAITDSRRCSRI